MSKQNKRVVITGLGVIAPNGTGSTAYWHAISNGITGIRPLPAEHEAFPGGVAGTVEPFYQEQTLDRKLIHRSDRMTHLVLTALHEALTDSRLQLSKENPHRIGVVIANTMGGIGFVLRQLQALYTKGPHFVSAYTAIAWLNVANVGQAAIHYAIQGYCKTPINDTAGGLHALCMATQAIKREVADVILAGGCEAFLHPLLLRIFAQRQICVSGNDPRAYRPFDRRAAGLILAEGAGICILEEYEHACRRGAPIYGEIIGIGQTNSADGLTIPSPDGRQYARALQQAADRLQSDELAYISLDGRALPALDQGEVEALTLTFGADAASIPVSVPRTMIGHSYAAAGAIDAITACLALRHRQIPPTVHCEEPGYPLNMVRERARPLDRGTAVLLGARGTGGSNIALLLKRCDEQSGEYT
ncbi:3-oxoacyl-[acyl-carrier-protein] synthase II [Thermosporothrix hazakensis]|uniref:3-oxoacyl-[acyl-carrier-protein] synthase II n=3 Tax=Thermosporothrix TaxID=768650 RepID=A0A326U343_THEHA|nr:3-oxoacyl-[acyl-carrier-protein] synthase II [Thermosporothrix hazakensis]BBH90665.1 3-oxoacyl-[acyl-carrier-protein] synthase 2 [Thermosporothrix sp. COM3]GCE48716.1 3-oxoacyl-[acyl-carrier-protein] synthase 2 [Thermosporothrix hazakensis]